MEMNIDFSELKIDGAIITEFKVVPSKKLVISLLRGPLKRQGKTVQTEGDLQFNSITDFRIILESEPWLQIISHAVFSESEYLTERLGSDVDPNNRRPSHFQIITDKGKFDIIALSVTFSEFNEIPYVEQS